MSALSTPAFLVDEGGLLVFYNEAAGMLLGKRFEELGTVGPQEWGSLFGPFDESGEPIPYDDLPLVTRRPRRPPRPRRADSPLDRRHRARGRGLGLPDPHPARLAGRDRGLLALAGQRQRSGAGVKVKLWGTRGSIPAPGPETIRYGGNTSCVGVTLSDGSMLALDAGTGIRCLGLALPDEPARLHILLTHLHLDHIQGLVFFAPAFRPQTEIVIWGPASPEASLRDRIARYISAPLSPVEVRELPCDVSFRHCPESEWEIGSARIRAASVSHRGPTLGYRIDDGDSSLAYIPDHEPALGADLDAARGGLDLGLRPRPGRLAADPRRPVHRRRVPLPRRLGPLGDLARAQLRPADRRRAHRPLPPRSAPLRRSARRARGAKRSERWVGARRRPGARSSWAPSGPSTSCRRGRRAPPRRLT